MTARKLPLVLDKPARQEAIRRLLRTREVATQEDLVLLLARDGFHVTQATLSRDLARLGAVRVSLPEGGTVYARGALAPSPEAAQLHSAEMVLELDHNDALTVIRTRPGAAPAVALIIDGSRLPECLGTLAGDDTIFATPSRGTSTKKLTQRLRSLLKGDNR